MCFDSLGLSHSQYLFICGGVSLCFWLHLLWLLVLVRGGLSELTAGERNLGLGKLDLVAVQHLEKARTGLPSSVSQDKGGMSFE